MAPIPFHRGLAVQQTGERRVRNKRGREKSRRLKVDLTLGSVTTDQNPLKAIDHFHYSSHVPHLETVYQTQRVHLHSLHRVHTHKDTVESSAHTHTHTKQYSFRSKPTALKHLYRLRGWVAHCKQMFTSIWQNSAQPGSVRWCDASSAYKWAAWCDKQGSVCSFFWRKYLSVPVDYSCTPWYIHTGTVCLLKVPLTHLREDS